MLNVNKNASKVTTVIAKLQAVATELAAIQTPVVPPVSYLRAYMQGV